MEVQVLSKPPVSQSWDRASASPSGSTKVTKNQNQILSHALSRETTGANQHGFILLAPSLSGAGPVAGTHQNQININNSSAEQQQNEKRKMVAVMSFENGNFPVRSGCSVPVKNTGSSTCAARVGKRHNPLLAEQMHRSREEDGRRTATEFSSPTDVQQQTTFPSQLSHNRTKPNQRGVNSGDSSGQQTFDISPDSAASSSSWRKKPLLNGLIKYNGPNVAQSFYYREDKKRLDSNSEELSNLARLNSFEVRPDMILRSPQNSAVSPSSHSEDGSTFQRSAKRRASYRAITPVNSHRQNATRQQISPVSPPQKVQQTDISAHGASNQGAHLVTVSYATKSISPSCSDKPPALLLNQPNCASINRNNKIVGIVPRGEEIGLFESKQQNCNSNNNKILLTNSAQKTRRATTSNFPTKIQQEWEAYYDENCCQKSVNCDCSEKLIKSLPETDLRSYGDSKRCQTLNRSQTSATNRRPVGNLRSAKSEVNIKESVGKLNSEMIQQQKNSMLSDQETYQIRLMYSGRATEIVICGCLANLYFSTRNSGMNTGKSEWELAATGVPVLLLDCGVSRARQSRRLQIVLAEKGTGFTLWRDVVDNLTRYTEVGKSFHTMLLSTDHKKIAGLSFDNSYASMQFYQQLTRFTSEPENVSLSASLTNVNLRQKRQNSSKSTDSIAYSSNQALNHTRSRRHSVAGNAKKLLKKAEISNPCCFNHVTSLKPHDLGNNEDRVKRTQSCLQISQNPALGSAGSSPNSSKASNSPMGSV